MGRGLAVLLDVVYNHFGPVGNYTGKFGPYIIDAHQTPWGGAVNLEAAWANQVRRFFCDNACMWMRDFQIDGLRLDAVHAFVDRSAIHFLEQLATETRALEAALGRPLALIAESDLNDPRMVTAQDAGGFGLDAQWSDDFQHALFAVLARQPQTGYYTDFGGMEQLKKALEETFVYDGIYSKHRKRVHGRPAAQLPQHRFLGYIQNHDQIGNRAIGDRLHQAVGHGTRAGCRRISDDKRVRSLDLRGRRMGGVVALPVLCRSRGSGDGEACLRGTQKRVCGIRLGPKRHSRSGETRDISTLAPQLGRSRRRRSRVDVGLVQGTDPAAAVASIAEQRGPGKLAGHVRRGEEVVEDGARRHHGPVQPGPGGASLRDCRRHGGATRSPSERHRG